MPGFELLYDFGRQWPMPWVLLSLTGLGAGLYLFLFPERMKDKQGRSLKRGQARLFGVYAMGMCGAVTYWMLSDYIMLRSALASGKYQQVEGPVENYIRQTKNVTNVWFKVQGVQFYTSNGTHDYGFWALNANIAEGHYVRIAYVARDKRHFILRLERQKQ